MFFANRSTFRFMHHFAMPLQLNLQDTGTEAQNSIKSYFFKDDCLHWIDHFLKKPS